MNYIIDDISLLGQHYREGKIVHVHREAHIKHFHCGNRKVQNVWFFKNSLN